MKKKRIFLILTIFASIVINSCETEDHFYNGPDMVSFADGTTGALDVKPTGESTFQISVGSTVITNADRTLNLSISSASTAIEGTHYLAISPLQVVIPAGECLGTITITAIYSGFSNDSTKTLILNLSGDNTLSDSEFSLSMQRSCPYDPVYFIGAYNVVDNRFHRNGNVVRTFVYEATVEEVSGHGNQLKIKNLGGYGGEVIIEITLNGKNSLPVSFATQTSGYDTEIFAETGLPLGDVTYKDRNNSSIDVCSGKLYINFSTSGSPGLYSLSSPAAEFTRK